LILGATNSGRSSPGVAFVDEVGLDMARNPGKLALPSFQLSSYSWGYGRVRLSPHAIRWIQQKAGSPAVSQHLNGNLLTAMALFAAG